MRAIIFLLCATAYTGACTWIPATKFTQLVNTVPENASLEYAEEMVGLSERYDRAQLTDVLGIDPVRTEWCAAFVNAILELDGIPGSESVSEYPLLARSFLEWGERVEPADIQRGDIVVFPRGNQGWQGHVGFFAGHDLDNNWVIVGGNQDNTVSYAIYKPTTAIGVRRWVDVLPVVD